MYVKQQQTNANTLVCVAGWALACWLGGGGGGGAVPATAGPLLHHYSQTKSQAPRRATHTKWNSVDCTHIMCVCNSTNQRWVPG